MDKLHYRSFVLLMLALVSVMFAGCDTTGISATGSASASRAAVTAPADQNAGHLIVRRAPNLGEALVLSIDGVQTSIIRTGDVYSGPLAPGPHVLSVILRPNQLNLRSTKKRLTVVRGQTYTLTASWQGETLVLR